MFIHRNRMLRSILGSTAGRFAHVGRTSGEGAGGGSGAGTGEGGAGTGDKGTGEGDKGGDGAGGDKGAGEGGKDGETEAEKIVRLETALTAARKEAGKDRTTAKAKAAEDARKALLDDVAKALGLKEGETVTAEQLQDQLKEAKAATNDSKIQLAVYRSASKAGADPDALLDSRSFLTSVRELDTTAKDFDALVAAEIKSAIEKNPKLKTTPTGAGRSGGEFPGGTGAGTARSASLGAAVGKHYTP
jgi:hypothetical protein